jgi:hypothetical protein
MTVVKEVADTVQLLSDIVQNTRDLLQAVNDGRKFLAREHPEASDDFAALLKQMEITVVGLAEVTKVITAFRFEVESPAKQSEGVRFNRYVINQKATIALLRSNIRQLKGRCDRVRALRDALNARAEPSTWDSMFGLLGKKVQARSSELGATLSSFYADDQRMIEAIEQVLEVAENAIADVEAALGPAGMSYASNVPAAAALLQIYSDAFRESERGLQRLADDLTDTANRLAPAASSSG